MEKAKEIKEVQEPQANTLTSFTPEQLEVVQRLIAESKSNQKDNGPLSVYGARDPREITHVKVSMFEGKFVIGFKDFQTNPYSKDKKFYQEKSLPERGLNRQPFVTLLLTSDGEDVEELEVALIDYMNYRTRIELPVESIEKKEVIEDHGVLGKRGEGMAVGLDSEGKPLSQLTLKAESKKTIMKFYVKLPDTDKVIEFTEDLLA